jgi:hypothetical protein
VLYLLYFQKIKIDSYGIFKYNNENDLELFKRISYFLTKQQLILKSRLSMEGEPIMFMIRNLITIFFLFQLCPIVFSQEISFPREEPLIFSFPVTWQPVTDDEKIKILQMLVKTSDSTLQKINTINGMYQVEYEQAVVEDPTIKRKFLNHVPTSDIIQKYDFSLSFFSDIKKEKTFYSKQIIQQIFETNGQKIESEGLVLFDVNSICSKQDYLYSISSDKATPNVTELLGFPEIEGKTIAWRESPETIQGNLVDFIDPCEYLRFKEWGNLHLILEAIEGKHGEESQKIVNNISSLFETSDNKGVKWYRFHQLFTNERVGQRELNIFFNQESGFHPICQLYTIPSHVTLTLLQVRWKKVNNIFFPVESRIAVKKNDGKLSYRRKMTLDDIEINRPIDSKQFSYSALGLSNGDILVDRIKQQVFTIKNDKPVYLAKFHEKYQTPSKRNFNRIRLSIMLLGFALIALGIYLTIRRRRIENKQKKITKNEIK